MNDELTQTLLRLDRIRSDWLVPAMVAQQRPAAVTAWDAPGEPVPWSEAFAQEFTALTPGEPWGPPWGTTWFRVDVDIPGDWDLGRTYLNVDLGFSHLRPGFQCEGTIWTADGRIDRAVEPMNHRVPLAREAHRSVVRFVEASANPNMLFADGDVTGTRLTSRPTPMGDVLTAPREPLYRFGGARLELIDENVRTLLDDLHTIEGIARTQDPTGSRAASITLALRKALAHLDPDDIAGTAPAARAALEDVLAQPARAGAHRVVAVGHAHIDSAWLWPARETRRKAARTFANALALMDADPEFVFAASSAQQFAWVEEDYPELFARIAERVSEGRFIPVGGMWVEADTNLPSGESLVRQFVEGTLYFQEKFGIETDELWLPDSFGYSAALPQIARAAGKRFALTQKLSWNDTNRFPFTTFWWEGHDGTRVFTHMPSVDIYNAELSATDLLRSDDQYAEKGRGDIALVPFGYGDGGGGPTREMLAQAKRAADIDGLPRVSMGTPAEFFAVAHEQLPDAPVWSGELYLELHRGTYTSQREMKLGNLRCENLFRDAEAVRAAASVIAGLTYPGDELRQLWRGVLLGQFHDVLPGTSIAWVHREMRETHRSTQARLAEIIAEGRAALDAVALPPAAARVESAPATAPATTAEDADGWTVTSDHLIVHVDRDGLLDRVFDRRSERDLVPPGGRIGTLQLHRDIPALYEAWEIEASYRDTQWEITDVDGVRLLDESDGVGVEVTRHSGSSTFVQQYVVDSTSAVVEIRTLVDWQHRHTLLKLAIPLDVSTDSVQYQIQHGYIERPTVRNTSWDRARFEVCGHRYVRAAEPGYGVAVVNDGIFGHEATREHRTGGGACTEIRQTLLRSPSHPDPDADRGRHEFRTRLVAGADTVDALREVSRLSAVPDHAGLEPYTLLFSPVDDAVVIDCVKLAFDGSGDVIVRMYEATGTRTRVHLRPRFAYDSARVTDVLERPAGEILDGADGELTLDLLPFHLVTARFVAPRWE